MLDLKIIINNIEEVKKNLINQGFKVDVIDVLADLSKSRSTIMTSLQNLEAKRNEISKEIGFLKSKKENVDSCISQVSNIKNEISQIKLKSEEVNLKINEILLKIPNLKSDDVPIGENDNDNVVIKEHKDLGRGKVEQVIPHYEIGKNKDIVDFERATKISGARFWAYKGDGALLVRALENMMLDIHIANGYNEWKLPFIVLEKTLVGTGQLPNLESDLFKLEKSNSYLIPTAEVPLTNIHREEILDLHKKPLSYVSFTQCFRAEAGARGKDLRGLIRAHQFNKVELVKFVADEDKDEEFQKLLDDAKNILELLELPYQEVLLCTKDTSFSSEKTIDLEVWIPSEKRYREISSISSFGKFQSRRASIRYRKDKQNIIANTINGSAIAIDRCVAAILENYQNDDGTITVPKILVPYMKKTTI